MKRKIGTITILSISLLLLLFQSCGPKSTPTSNAQASGTTSLEAQPTFRMTRPMRPSTFAHLTLSRMKKLDENIAYNTLVIPNIPGRNCARIKKENSKQNFSILHHRMIGSQHRLV